jgi:hypothetical protein
MVKSLIADPIKGGSNGYVAGFWNGKCGAVDKSKPPVGGMVLQRLLSMGSLASSLQTSLQTSLEAKRSSASRTSKSGDGEGDKEESLLWVGELLIDQFVMWNRWWKDTRQQKEPSTPANHSTTTSNGNSGESGNSAEEMGMIAPGSTRAMLTTAISCNPEPPASASRCETGLDNSPIYDGAQFVTAANALDQTDVGMSALYALDCAALANVSKLLGRKDYAAELGARATAMANGINNKMWSESDGLYFNRKWQAGSWAPKVAAPTNFYPLLSNIATDAQVTRMVSRWLANESEFCVKDTTSLASSGNSSSGNSSSSSGNSSCGTSPGMPSVSRSNAFFEDNNYWRGRSWGPMNMLVFFGLQHYAHLPAAAAARKALAAQSEAAFLVEWTKSHRVMENYNSQSGVGCDVGNAIPFYHWGALNALIPLIESTASI